MCLAASRSKPANHSPSVFIWEGVTNQLTTDAVDAVLRYVASCADGSRVVFTYVHRGAPGRLRQIRTRFEDREQYGQARRVRWA